MDRGGGAVQGGRDGLSEMWAPDVAGASVAPPAQEGRQAMGKRGVAGVVQAPLPLPAVPQGVHGARPGLWAQETYHQQAQEDGGQTGKRSYGEGGSAGGGGERRAGGEELAGGAQCPLSNAATYASWD